MYPTGLSVVIPNYNGETLFPQTLPPLFEALADSGLPHEVIVSDDCSTDQSVRWLQTNYPAIKVIAHTQNRGFSPTINDGIREARYSLVFLLNSDVKLTRHYFEPQLRYFEKPDTFGVMGRIIGWEDEIIQDAAKYPSFHGAKIKTTGNYYAQQPAANDWLYSMYLSGANALVSKSKLDQLDGFDALFAPFYVEDYELSLRAWRIGWKCYYEHQAVCRHQVSVTIKNKARKNEINTIYYRNKMFLHALHLEGSARWLWTLQLLPETLLRVFTGRFYYVRSLWQFVAQLPAMRRSKQAFMALSARQGKLLSVRNVVDLIVQQIGNRPIHRF